MHEDNRIMNWQPFMNDVYFSSKTEFEKHFLTFVVWGSGDKLNLNQRVGHFVTLT